MTQTLKIMGLTFEVRPSYSAQFPYAVYYRGRKISEARTMRDVEEICRRYAAM